MSHTNPSVTATSTTVRFDVPEPTTIPPMTVKPYIQSATATGGKQRTQSIQQQRETAIQTWLRTNCPTLSEETAVLYSQMLYRSTYDTVLRFAQKIHKSGPEWLTVDLKFDVLDADDILTALRAEGLLLPAPIEEVIGPETTTTTATSAEVPTRKVKGKKDPVPTEAQLLEQQQEATLCQWLQLNCGSVYPEDAVDYAKFLRLNNAVTVERIAKKIILLTQAESRRLRTSGTSSGSTAVSMATVGCAWLVSDVHFDETHAQELVLALQTAGWLQDSDDNTGTRTKPNPLDNATNASFGEQNNVEGQKRLLAESYSAPEVRQLASQALLIPEPVNVNVRGMGPGAENGQRTMPLGGESMLERRINQLQSSASIPTINSNNISKNDITSNNPTTIPAETSTPIKPSETTVEPIPSVLSPLQICEQNAGILTSLLARMPPLPQPTTSPSPGVVAEGTGLDTVPASGPGLGPAPEAGLEPGVFDWRIASLRRVSLFGGGCQAAMSNIAQVSSTGSHVVLARLSQLGVASDLVTLLRHILSLLEMVFVPRWYELSTESNDNTTTGPGQGTGSTFDQEESAQVTALIQGLGQALVQGNKALRALAVDPALTTNFGHLQAWDIPIRTLSLTLPSQPSPGPLALHVAVEATALLGQLADGHEHITRSILLQSTGGSVLVQVGEHVKKLGGGASNDRLLQLALGSLLSLSQASVVSPPRLLALGARTLAESFLTDSTDADSKGIASTTATNVKPFSSASKARARALCTALTLDECETIVAYLSAHDPPLSATAAETHCTELALLTSQPGNPHCLRLVQIGILEAITNILSNYYDKGAVAMGALQSVLNILRDSPTTKARCVALGLDVLATLVTKRTKRVLDKGYTEARLAVQELSLDPCEQALSVLTGCSTSSDATEALAVAGLQGVLGLLVVSSQQDESQVKRHSRRLREVGVCEALVVVLQGYPLSAAVTEVALNLINTLALLSSANKTKLGGLGVEALVRHARTHRPFASPIDGYALMCDDALQLVGDEERDLLASLTRARAEKLAEQQNKEKGSDIVIKEVPVEAYTWSAPMEGDEEVEGVSLKDPVEVLVNRVRCVELKNTAAAGCGLNDMDIFVTLQMGDIPPLQTAIQENAGSSVSYDYQETAAGSVQGLGQGSDVAMDKNVMKWDHMTVADVLVNGINQLPELKTEIRPNAGAMASYDYINDKTDQKYAETMKWMTTVGKLSMSKLSWSVWDWNDPKGNDKRDDVCIGSADGVMMMKKIREGRTAMSETITFDNQSFDSPDKKKIPGKVTIVVNIQVMETEATTPNPSKDPKRIITKEDMVEVSFLRIETNELPHVKSGGPGLSGLNKNNVYMKLKLIPNDFVPKPPSRLVLSVWDHNTSGAHTKIGSVDVDVAGLLKDIRAGGNIYEEDLSFSIENGNGLFLRNDRRETAGKVSLTLRVKVHNPQANAGGVSSSDPMQTDGTIQSTLAPLPLGLGLMYLPSALPDAVAALNAVSTQPSDPLTASLVVSAMAAISDLIHNGANDLTGVLTGNLTGNLTGTTAPTPIQSGERRRAMVARDLGLLHCCEGVASAFLGYYQDYGEVCQQGLQTMLDLCLDPTNRLKLASCQIEPIVREILRESTLTNTATKKKGKHGRVMVALCDWLGSLTPCERAMADLYRVRQLYQDNQNHTDDDSDDNNNNNNNNTITTNNVLSPIKGKINPKGLDMEYLSQVDQTMAHLLTLLYTSTSTLAPSSAAAFASITGTANPPTTNNNNSFPESFPLSSTGLQDGSDPPLSPPPPVEQQVLPLVGNLRILRSLHATDLLVEVMGGMVGINHWTWPVDREGEGVTGSDEMNNKTSGLGLAPGPRPAPEQMQGLAPVLLQALRVLSCLVGDGFDLKLQSNHLHSMNHTSNTFAVSGGLVGGGTATPGVADRAPSDGPFFRLSALLSQIACWYPQDEDMQLVLLPLLLVVLTSSMPCKIHSIDLDILPRHITHLLEAGQFRSPLHTQAQECLTQLALTSSEQAIMPLTTHPLTEGDALTACLRVVELAELYEERRPLGRAEACEALLSCLKTFPAPGPGLAPGRCLLFAAACRALYWLAQDDKNLACMRDVSFSSPSLVDILVGQLKGLVTVQGTYDASVGRGITEVVGGGGVGSVRAVEEGLVLLATLLGATGTENNDPSIPTSVPYVRMDMTSTADMVMCCLSVYAHSLTAASSSSSGGSSNDHSDSNTSARVAWHGCVILIHLIQVAVTATTGGSESSDTGPVLSVRQLALGAFLRNSSGMTAVACAVRVLLSLESYPDDTQLARGAGDGGELPIPSVLLPRRGVVAMAACQALASMLNFAPSSSSSSSFSSSAPSLASLVGWIPLGCGSVVDVLRICIGDIYATTAALNALVALAAHKENRARMVTGGLCSAVVTAVNKVMFDDGSNNNNQNNNNNMTSDALITTTTTNTTTLNPSLPVPTATAIVEAVCALLATLLRPQGLKVRCVAAGAITLLRSLASLPVPPSTSETTDHTQGLVEAMDKAQGLARKFVLGPFEQAVSDLMTHPLSTTETTVALQTLIGLIDSNQERNLQRSVARSLGHLDACAVVVAAWKAHYKPSNNNNNNNNSASTMSHPQQEVTRVALIALSLLSLDPLNRLKIAAYDIRAIALEVAKDTTLEDTLRSPAKELANRLTLVDYSGYPVLPTSYSTLSSLLTQPLSEAEAVMACQGLTAVVFIEKTRTLHSGNLTVLLDAAMDAPSVVLDTLRLHQWNHRVLEHASKALYYLLYDTPLQPPPSSLGDTGGTQGVASDGLTNTDTSLGATGSSNTSNALSSPGKKHKKRSNALGGTNGGMGTPGHQINHLPRLRSRLVARGAVEVLFIALAAQLAIAQSNANSHRGEKDNTHSASHSSAAEHACAALASIIDTCPQGKETMGLWKDPGITTALPLPSSTTTNSGGNVLGSNAFDVLFTTLRFHKWSVGACEQGLRLLVLSTEGLGDNQQQAVTAGACEWLVTVLKLHLNSTLSHGSKTKQNDPLPQSNPHSTNGISGPSPSLAAVALWGCKAMAILTAVEGVVAKLGSLGACACVISVLSMCLPTGEASPGEVTMFLSEGGVEAGSISAGVVEAACGAIANLCEPIEVNEQDMANGNGSMDFLVTPTHGVSTMETNAAQLGRLGVCEMIVLALKSAVQQLPPISMTTISSGGSGNALERLLQLLCTCVYFLASNEETNQTTLRASPYAVTAMLQKVAEHPAVSASHEYASAAVRALTNL